MARPSIPVEYQAPPAPGVSLTAASVARANLLRAVGSILGPLIGLVLVFLIFGAWKPELFLTRDAVENVFRNNYHYAVAAVGATFVIITAGIDLSCGSVMALSCVCCALVIRGFSFPTWDVGQAGAIGGGLAIAAGLCGMGRAMQNGATRWRSAQVGMVAAAAAFVIGFAFWWIVAGHVVRPMPVVVGILAGVLTGAAVGWVNGALITFLSLPPFIITLATLEGVRGLALYMTDAIPVSGMPGNIRALHSGSVLGFPPNVWIAVLVTLAAIPVLHFSVLGRYTYAIGSNERTARLCGVHVERWKTICYVIAGATAGLAGVMMCAKFNSAPPDEFKGVELTVIAAEVIGGTSLFGGEGTVMGSVLGVLMLGFLYTGCNIAQIDTNVQRIFIGGTIVLAAALDRFRHLAR